MGWGESHPAEDSTNTLSVCLSPSGNMLHNQASRREVQDHSPLHLQKERPKSGNAAVREQHPKCLPLNSPLLIIQFILRRGRRNRSWLLRRRLPFSCRCRVFFPLAPPFPFQDTMTTIVERSMSKKPKHSSLKWPPLLQIISSVQKMAAQASPATTMTYQDDHPILLHIAAGSHKMTALDCLEIIKSH